MKAPLLFCFIGLLSTGCGFAPNPPVSTTFLSTTEADHATVQAFVKKNITYPESYRPLYFKDYATFSRLDSATWQYELRHGDVDLPSNNAARADTVHSTGRMYVHQYQARNKSGEVQVFYKVFAVYNNGVIQAGP